MKPSVTPSIWRGVFYGLLFQAIAFGSCWLALWLKWRSA